jgi:hypothetical protein
MVKAMEPVKIPDVQPVDITGNDSPDSTITSTGAGPAAQPRCGRYSVSGPLRTGSRARPLSLGPPIDVADGLLRGALWTLTHRTKLYNGLLRHHVVPAGAA